MRGLLRALRNRASSDDELAAALAGAGALTAAGWSWVWDFDVQRAAQLMASGGPARSWTPPPLAAYDRIGALAPDIAAAWALSFTVARQGPARLFLRPAGLAWEEDDRGPLLEAARALLAGLGRLRGGGVRDWRGIEGRTIGSVALQVGSGARGRTRWRWPLRLSVEGVRSSTFDAAFAPAERGLSRAVELGAPSEYALTRSLDGLASAESHVAALITGVGQDPVGRLFTARGSPVARSTAWLEGDLDTSAFAQGLVFESAHDAPPDLALSLAWVAQGGDTGPPILLGGEDYFAQMQAARLSQAVADLPARLEALGRLDDSPVALGQDARAFGMDVQQAARPSRLAKAIRRAVRGGRVSYDSEGAAAEAASRLTGRIAEREADLAGRALGLRREAGEALLGPRTTSVGEGGAQTRNERIASIERDRVSDLRLLSGGYWPGDLITEDARVADDVFLDGASDYTLEVAIRAQRLGVPGDGEKIAPPRRDRERTVVYARVIPRADIKLEAELLKLVWPFDEDSTPALFRFRTGGPVAGGVLLEVRLLSADLRLLDQIVLGLEAGVWRARSMQVATPLARPSGEPSRDALALSVARAGGGFVVAAELVRDGAVPLALPVVFDRVTPEADVARLLAEVRRHWTQLVIGQMSSRMQLSEPSYALARSALAELGRDAWRLLFGDRRGVGTGAAETLGDLLRARPLPPGAAIRVSFCGDAQDFAFPWTIVTAPRTPGETFEPEAWGLRHQIEIGRAQGRPPLPAKGSLRITATVDDGFAAFVDHRKTLKEVVDAHAGVALSTADLPQSITAALGAEDPADIFYFFCHGVAAGGGGGLATDVLGDIREETAKLPEADRKPWELLLGKLSGAAGGARIFTGKADLSERNLRDVDFFQGARRPLVFLNMCHSAAMLPGSHAGLAAVFLDRDAIAVIGAEAPITAPFADAFARELLGRLFDGESLGAAMLAVRRKFHEQRNPLALIYTLYGRGDVALRAATAPGSSPDLSFP